MDEIKKPAELEPANQLSELLARLSDSKEISEIQKLTHELQMHQIELEMQNRELREAQQNLEESRNRYADLYDFTPVSYLSLDERGIIHEINLTGATMLGLERDRIIGKPFTSFLENVEQSKFFNHLKTAFQSKNNVIDEVQLHRRGNSSITAEIESRCFDSELDMSRLCRVIVTDISERKRWVNELLTAKNEAESANRAKSEFLSSMSHELRTPLNAILGFAQLIDLSTLDEASRTSAHEIINAGEHLLSLINQVLDFSKIESGTIELSIEKCLLNETVDNMLTLIKPLADKNSVHIVNNLTSPYYINVDKTLFKQVILNIISNAIKYNTTNGNVIIDSSGENNMLLLSITDTGNGLTPEQQIRIFQPFDRAGKENSSIEGTGLGLKISKDLIELLGGTISVESTVGKGSVFFIRVPLS